MGRWVRHSGGFHENGIQQPGWRQWQPVVLFREHDEKDSRKMDLFRISLSLFRLSTRGRFDYPCRQGVSRALSAQTATHGYLLLFLYRVRAVSSVRTQAKQFQRSPTDVWVAIVPRTCNPPNIPDTVHKRTADGIGCCNT